MAVQDQRAAAVRVQRTAAVRVLIAGDSAHFARYAEAVRHAGMIPVFADGMPPENCGIPPENNTGLPENCRIPPENNTGLPENCDALLLPGGGDIDPARYGQINTASRNINPARDAWEFQLLELFTNAAKPVLGICRGLQVINVFFGGTLIQDIPGHSQISGADRMHTVHSAGGFFSGICGASCQVNSAHHQAVDRPGTGLQPGQWTADGIIEALRHQDSPVTAVQWHPERLSAPAGERLFQAFAALCAERSRRVWDV